MAGLSPGGQGYGMIVGIDHVQIFEFRDPFGNRLELIQARPIDN